jgi:hypothetical protein
MVDSSQPLTYRFPKFPAPLTIAIAAARLLVPFSITLSSTHYAQITHAGGRGTAFDTQTKVMANPKTQHEVLWLLLVWPFDIPAYPHAIRKRET